MIAVLSDIHGNHHALAACLDYARQRGAQGYLFLGDYISDGAYPQKTMELLYEAAAQYPCRFLRGNREEYMLACREKGGLGWRDGSASGSLLYTYENLTGKDLDWFAGLPAWGEESFPGCPPLAYCHGSFRKANGLMAQGSPETLEMLAEIGPRLVLRGHTHRWCTYDLAGKHVVSAGSVGLPLGTPGHSQMLLLHEVGGRWPRWREELCLVPYDADAAAKELEDSGLARHGLVWTAMIRHVLLTGENMCLLLPTCAQALYQKASGIEAGWDGVPEEFWQQAAAEYGVAC